MSRRAAGESTSRPHGRDFMHWLDKAMRGHPA
jgi:hypothetical protein